MKRLSHALEGACSRNALMGVEGQAARTYFRAFATLVKDDACGTFDFQTRNRRPPRDPVNAMLSFGYALLMKEALVATLAVGLDSFLGIYHQPHTGRDSLALDLMEEFRPLIVDSTVLTLINTRALRAEHFQVHAHGCALTQTGRRTFIEAYERRMEQLISHPAFGYPISYRRVLEVQARLFSRYLLGELQHYQPFVTR